MICFYCISTQLGGAERSLLELLESMVHGNQNANSRTRPWVVVPMGEGPLVERLRAIGIEVTVLPLPKGALRVSRESPVKSLAGLIAGTPSTIRYYGSLKRLLRERAPVLIHTTGIKCHLIGALAGRRLGIPVLWHLRDILRPGITRFILRFFAEHARVHLISNSRASARALDARIRSDHIDRVIYNGLPPARYRVEPNSLLHREFRIPETAPLVGILGVLARWKGQLEFIAMAERLVRAGSDARFVIAGGRIYDTDGDRAYEAELSAAVAARGLTERIFFAGFRADAVSFLNGLDALVHASVRPEPFGRVVLEAMACGVPVVATRGGGIEEFVRDEENGILVTPGDSDEMADAVSRVLADPNLSDRLREAGLDQFRRSFTVDRHREAILRAYDEILPSRGRDLALDAPRPSDG